jgi:hypothetical protein
MMGHPKRAHLHLPTSRERRGNRMSTDTFQVLVLGLLALIVALLLLGWRRP